MLKGEEGRTPDSVNRSIRIMLAKKGSHRSWKTGRVLKSERQQRFRSFDFVIEIGTMGIELGSQHALHTVPAISAFACDVRIWIVSES